MATDTPDIQAIFSEAVARDSGEQRALYLAEVCGDDLKVRARVEALLRAHEEAGGFFGGPDEATALPTVTERPGDTIGPYKLVEQIGEGGFGVVFLAEQTKPFRREVALKVVKAGMDTKEVVARFEAERQALAMMDHPNIAKVLGAGATESGRPYFVMELVPGIPITEYCDQCRLTIRERLELFVAVCQAVQHAHQKGVIHRDLKPSNVLIAMQDGRPVPKIIDFGVAKAINQRLTDHTLKTRFAQIIGTPLYMSPEQAELSPLGVDTRSDIYSLGVLLYELLTGTTPFEKDRLHSASFDELRQIIREEEPPRPSTRLSTLAGEVANTVADHQRTDPRQLLQTLRGDLDWLVMKAMEKDRNRRYESASSLAQDVERYLADEPVEACPPSAAYKFRKFVRRNKAILATLTAVAAALLVGTSLAIWQAYRATEERDRAMIAESVASEQAERADEEAQRANREADKGRAEAAIAKAVNDFFNKDILAQANPFELPEKDVKLREVVDLASEKVEGRFADEPLVEAAIHATLCDSYKSIGEYKLAERHSRLAMEIRKRVLGEEDISTLHAMRTYADILYRLRRRADSEHMARRVLELSIRALGPENDLLADIHNQIAIALHRQGRMDEAREHYRESIKHSERIDGAKDFVTMTSLGIATQGREERVRILREALEIGKCQLGEDHISLADTMYWLAMALGSESEEAAELHGKVLEMRLRVLGPNHPHTKLSRSHVALMAGRDLAKSGNNEQAIAKFTDAINLQTHGMHFYYEDRGRAYAAIGEWEKAVADYDQAIQEFPAALPWICDHRAAAYVQLKEWDKAAADLLVSAEHRPEDEMAWLRLAPVLVLSGNEAAYENFCHQLIKAYEEAPQKSFADVVCKASLLRPGVVSFDQLPVDVLDKALTEGTANHSHMPWYWGTKALVAYRRDDPEAALAFVENAQASNPEEAARALNLLIRSLALWQLHREKEASQSLDDAAEVIALLEESQEYEEEQPVLRDLLIAKIFYAEAEALLNGHGKIKESSEPNTDSAHPVNQRTSSN